MCLAYTPYHHTAVRDSNSIVLSLHCSDVSDSNYHTVVAPTHRRTCTTTKKAVVPYEYLLLLYYSSCTMYV